MQRRSVASHDLKRLLYRSHFLQLDSLLHPPEWVRQVAQTNDADGGQWTRVNRKTGRPTAHVGYSDLWLDGDNVAAIEELRRPLPPAPAAPTTAAASVSTASTSSAFGLLSGQGVDNADDEDDAISEVSDVSGSTASSLFAWEAWEPKEDEPAAEPPLPTRRRLGRSRSRSSDLSPLSRPRPPLSPPLVRCQSTRHSSVRSPSSRRLTSGPCRLPSGSRSFAPGLPRPRTSVERSSPPASHGSSTSRQRRRSSIRNSGYVSWLWSRERFLASSLTFPLQAQNRGRLLREADIIGCTTSGAAKLSALIQVGWTAYSVDFSSHH